MNITVHICQRLACTKHNNSVTQRFYVSKNNETDKRSFETRQNFIFFRQPGSYQVSCQMVNIGNMESLWIFNGSVLVHGAADQPPPKYDLLKLVFFLIVPVLIFLVVYITVVIFYIARSVKKKKIKFSANAPASVSTSAQHAVDKTIS
ncbi:hypothetical protein HELRODRAFT_182033 [Helobdella robusta]|uniref:Uncharacterized protein n=1 Tax=Helobdella robusta TaxID=6412 RepID=T1FHM2_HELRO|nr:hypothetical protein HELRODRAFT_182033 [Helobdella robusta]ESN91856.1 hypothetical protein HELRODRAFT_182033 [Helobdella robusta]